MKYSLILAALLGVTLAACGEKPAPAPKAAAPAAPAAAAPAAPAAAAPAAPAAAPAAAAPAAAPAEQKK